MPALNRLAGHPFRILAAISFHFRSSRLQYLFQVIRGLCEYPVEYLKVVILTNANDEEKVKQIEQLCLPLFAPVPMRQSKKELSIESVSGLSNPWLLPWSHKHLITDEFLAAHSTLTHFIYLEDDVLLSFDNLCYFDYYVGFLKERKLIPSFQRVEYNDLDNKLYFVDQLGVSNFELKRHVDIGDYAFVNLDYPYNALYILDRDLAQEYVRTPSFDREHSKQVKGDWDVACRAAMGLCFEGPPVGFSKRYVSPVDPVTRTTPPWSWVYHLPNNYVKNRFKPFSKIRTDQLFSDPKQVNVWNEPSTFFRLLDRIRRQNASGGPDEAL